MESKLSHVSSVPRSIGSFPCYMVGRQSRKTLPLEHRPTVCPEVLFGPWHPSGWNNENRRDQCSSWFSV
jgi:hypothetical protein